MDGDGLMCMGRFVETKMGVGTVLVYRAIVILFNCRVKQLYARVNYTTANTSQEMYLYRTRQKRDCPHTICFLRVKIVDEFFSVPFFLYLLIALSQK